MRFWKLAVLPLALASGQVLAERNVAAEKTRQDLSDFQIVFLGTAGGPPVRPLRSAPATIVKANGHLILVDCGVGCLRRLGEKGLSSQDVDVVILTHLHPDHILDLSNLMADRVFRGSYGSEGLPLKIYGPPGTAELVKQGSEYLEVAFSAFAAAGSTARDTMRFFEVNEVQGDGEFYRHDGLQITAAENSHYQNRPKGSHSQKSYSYRISSEMGDVTFSGDTGPSEALQKLAEASDVLVAEVVDLPLMTKLLSTDNGVLPKLGPDHAIRMAAHMEKQHLTAGEIAKIAENSKVKSLILHHFGPEFEQSGTGPTVRFLKRKLAGTAVFAAADQDTFCLRRVSEASNRRRAVRCEFKLRDAR